MATYCLFDNLEITDPDALAEYAGLAAATVEQYGGLYLVIGGDFERKEGTWEPAFPVLIEFPDRASADAWYDSPESAPLKALRQTSGTFNAVFIDDQAPSAA